MGLSLSLLLTRVTDALYRKRFRASYNYKEETKIMTYRLKPLERKTIPFLGQDCTRACAFRLSLFCYAICVDNLNIFCNIRNLRQEWRLAHKEKWNCSKALPSPIHDNGNGVHHFKPGSITWQHLAPNGESSSSLQNHRHWRSLATEHPGKLHLYSSVA